MFQFKEGGMYQMPVHFGPCCGPRRGPDGERFFSQGPQESTQHILVYETTQTALEQVMPEGFSVRKPFVIVTHKMHRNLPWLAGHGYNVTTFNTPVVYQGKQERIMGQYQLAIWENHADPILCGREQLGYSKIFADIEDIHICCGVAQAGLSSWGFRFLDLHVDANAAPEDEELLKSALFDPDNQGLLHYKYFPRTGDGFSQADVACVTLSPAGFRPPMGVAPVPPAERSFCSGSLAWHIPTWHDMPTQYHVVQGLAALPVLRVVGASTVHLLHYNDVYDQRIVL